jgi:hypothetical protein
MRALCAVILAVVLCNLASAEVCPLGQTGDHPACLACDAGKYKEAVGNDNCTDCEAGKYGDEVGSAECTDCEAGKYGVATAQTAEAACKKCTANSTSKQSSNSIADCTCLAGFFMAMQVP